MFNNVKAKKRLTQVIIAFVIICMSVTGSFLLLEDSVDTVFAADRDVSTKAQWDAVMGEAASGGTWNIKLTGNLEMTGTSGYKLNPVPAGATVNLNMNNFSITWDYSQNGGNWNTDMMADSYGGSYSGGTHWGLITNNGTLNISGTGTIRNRKIHITRQKTDKDNSAQRLAAIVNSGNLTVGGNITIDAYLTHVHNSDDTSSEASYSDNYLYNFGIYSSAGTVTSAAKINVGGMTGTSQDGDASGRAYDFNYGIYGGGNTKVNVTGGNIYVDSFAGGFMETGNSRGAHIYASAVGVYGNNALITGNTTINVLTRNWESQDQNSNTWENGIDHLFSAGIMYTGSGSSNSPILGPSVDVVASFEHIGDNETQVYVPGAGDTGYSWSGVYSDGGSNNTSHVATPVAGVSAVRNNIGTHTSEKDYAADGGFFGGTTPWASIGSGADANRQYRTVQSYFSGANSVATAPQVNNGNNDSTRQTASIVNGVPGNTGSAGLTNSNLGNAGTHSPAASGFKSTGSQYMVVYRYYRDVNNIDAVSFKYNNPARVDSKATMKVAGADNTNGVLPNNAATLSYSSGAASSNEKYYEFIGRTYETVESANAGLASRIADINRDTGVANTPSLWAGSKGIFPNDGTTVASDKDNTIIVYMDYQLKDPTDIRIVASDKDVQINQYTTSTRFTVGYTGSALVPGEDFNLGIIDMGINNSVDTNDTIDDTVVTDVYNYNFKDSNKITVNYRHSANGTDWNPGLPKDAGTYKIEVSVNADTTFKANNPKGSYNRNAAQAIIDCTINRANVTISGSTSITVPYGSRYDEIINFDNYKATNKNNETVPGTWTLAGVPLDSTPDAGSYTNLRIVWTPDSANSKNYGQTEYPITLVVNKRPVTVTVGAATATYGNVGFNSNDFLSYGEDFPAVDADKQAGWLANTTFAVKNIATGVESDFHVGLPAGNYELSISQFGGAADSNYTFSFTKGTLQVQQRPIYYTAEVDGKTYDGLADVNVTLKFESGSYDGAPYEPIYNNVKGIMETPNAGENKVTVVTDNLRIDNNYKLVIRNAADLIVKVEKAVPSGVSVKANIDGNSIVYDKTRTLGDITLVKVTENPNIPGDWTWVDSSIIPDFETSSYTAKFTPAPSHEMNYTTYEMPVSITVEKAPVSIIIRDPVSGESEIQVTYGDSVPNLEQYIWYEGFTGDDTLAKLIEEGEAEGNIGVSTNYAPGSSVGITYNISVSEELSADNYSFTTKNGTINVNKKILTVTAKDKSITYGDPMPKFNASEDVEVSGFIGNDSLNTIGATVNFSTPYRQHITNGKVGDYAITVSVSATNNNNYDFSYVDGTLTVGKAVITLTPKVKTIKYGSAKPVYSVLEDCIPSGFKYDEQTISALAGYDSSIEPVFSTAYTSESFVNTYPVSVDASDMISDNYTFQGVAGSISVIKADLTIQNVPTATVVNSHTLAEATFDTSNTVVVNQDNNAKTVEGTFTFVDSAFAPEWRVDGNYGSYTAIFTPDDDRNYNTKEVEVFITLLEKDISGTPIIQGSAMVESTLTVNLASMDPTSFESYTYQWYRVDGNNHIAINNATDKEYKVTQADLDKTIYVVLVADEEKGFKGNAKSAETAVIIEALDPTTLDMFVSIFPTDIFNAESGAYELEYDDDTHGVDVKVKSEYDEGHKFGDITVKYNGVASEPENAGKYIVTIDVGTPKSVTGNGYDDGYIYHAPVSGLEIGILEITPASINAQFAANDKIYDGNVTASANMTISGYYENDHVNLGEGIRFAFADANAGEHEIIVSNVTLVGADAGNYKVVVEPTTAKILPRTLIASARGIARDFNESATVEVEFYDIEGYAPVDNENTVYLINGTATAASANAGEHFINGVDCDLDGKSAGNYVVEIRNEGIAKVVINKARPTYAPLVITHINGEKIVYNSLVTLGSFVPDNYHSEKGSWKFVDETIVPTVKQQTYAAIYTPESDNYYAVTDVITVIVEKKEVTITAENKTVTYGSNAPTYTTTQKGFTGTDSLANVGGTLRVSSEYLPGAPIDGYYPINVDVRFLVSDNYSFVGVPSVLTVNRRVINATAVAEDKTYNGNRDIKVNFDLDESGIFVNDIGEVDLSFLSTTGTASTANAGNVTVSYTEPRLNGDKAKNYELNLSPRTGALTAVIFKADVSGVTFPSNAQVEFGFDLSYATFGDGGSGDGTFAYENAKLTVPGALGVYDSYKVIFTPTDSTNYNSQEAVVSLQVVKCTLNYVVGIAGTLQSGQTLSVVTTGLPATANDYINYQWYRVDGNNITAIKGATDRTYVATDADIGYTLAVMTSFDSSDPYVFADGIAETIDGIMGIIGESTDAIKEIKLTFWQRLMNWLYRIIAVLTGIQLGGGLGIGG